MVWTYLGDALWVAALTIMFSASRHAAGLWPQGERARMMGVEMSRELVLWALPGGAFALSLWFAWFARTHDLDVDVTIILFGIRALSASTVALLHLRWLAQAHRP